jgi:DNA topoisomerase IB
VDEDGERIDELEVLERIRELVIPPAWENVWICPYPFGHIQAVGTDAAGRRQYIYHQRWRERRDQEKFDEMIRFARALPSIRKTAARHLGSKGMPRERVLACAVRLLERGFFRIGTEGYAEQNQTYGLATMQKRHVTLADDYVITFDFIAKGGKRRVQSIVDPKAYAVVEVLKRRRSGQELLAYQDGRRWVDVRSDDINDYIKEVTGEGFSAKDFRTWSATVIAAVGLAVSGRAASTRTARQRAVARAIKEVSHYLGNTPAVCRASYIDPRVFTAIATASRSAGLSISSARAQTSANPRFRGRSKRPSLTSSRASARLQSRGSPRCACVRTVTSPWRARFGRGRRWVRPSYWRP